MPCEGLGVLLLENLQHIILIYINTGIGQVFARGYRFKSRLVSGDTRRMITLLMNRPLHPPPGTQAFVRLYRTLRICILRQFL